MSTVRSPSMSSALNRLDERFTWISRLEALKGKRTVSELATAYEAHLLPAGVCMQTPRGGEDPSMEEGGVGSGGGPLRA